MSLYIETEFVELFFVVDVDWGKRWKLEGVVGEEDVKILHSVDFSARKISPQL
jgi:hypothetical protein